MSKEIVLSQGKVAIVDDEDYESLDCYTWCFSHGYAYRKDKKKTVYLHRQIMGFPKQRIDHRDRNSLNNQKENLRLCTRGGLNTANSKIRKDNTSKIRGVIWDKERGKWRAEIRVCGKTFYLGRFNNSIEAAKKYNEAARKHFGEFAYLNSVCSVGGIP